MRKKIRHFMTRKQIIQIQLDGRLWKIYKPEKNCCNLKFFKPVDYCGIEKLKILLILLPHSLEQIIIYFMDVTQTFINIKSVVLEYVN